MRLKLCAWKVWAGATALLGLALAACAPAGAAEDAYDGRWHFSLTPYVWVPSIDGTLNFNTPPGASGQPQVSITPINFLEYLNVPVMLAGEARKGNWSLFTDIVYVDFSGEKAVVKSVSGPLGLVQVPIDAGSQVGLRGTVWTLGGSYTAIRGPSATLDVLGGFRYLSVTASLDWQFSGGIGLLPASGSFSQSEHLWTAIVGVKGKVKLGTGNWFVPYYLDVGTASSTQTWQAVAGIGYALTWGDVLLVYRHLQYDGGDDKLIGQLRLGGPALGVSFRF
jgi:hypothetical protein